MRAARPGAPSSAHCAIPHTAASAKLYRAVSVCGLRPSLRVTEKRSQDSTLTCEAHAKVPPAQGLFNPADEKDACGVGFVGELTKEPTRACVTDALGMLFRMAHRGACGCEANTGEYFWLFAAVDTSNWALAAQRLRTLAERELAACIQHCCKQGCSAALRSVKRPPAADTRKLGGICSDTRRSVCRSTTHPSYSRPAHALPSDRIAVERAPWACSAYRANVG